MNELQTEDQMTNVAETKDPMADPLLNEQNSRLRTVTDEIATSRATIASHDAMIVDIKKAKTMEQTNLARLLKIQQIMRRAVFGLAAVQQDSVQ